MMNENIFHTRFQENIQKSQNYLLFFPDWREGHLAIGPKVPDEFGNFHQS